MRSRACRSEFRDLEFDKALVVVGVVRSRGGASAEDHGSCVVIAVRMQGWGAKPMVRAYAADLAKAQIKHGWTDVWHGAVVAFVVVVVFRCSRGDGSWSKKWLG